MLRSCLVRAVLGALVVLALCHAASARCQRKKALNCVQHGGGDSCWKKYGCKPSSLSTKRGKASHTKIESSNRAVMRPRRGPTIGPRRGKKSKPRRKNKRSNPSTRKKIRTQAKANLAKCKTKTCFKKALGKVCREYNKDRNIAHSKAHLLRVKAKKLKRTGKLKNILIVTNDEIMKFTSRLNAIRGIASAAMGKGVHKLTKLVQVKKATTMAIINEGFMYQADASAVVALLLGDSLDKAVAAAGKYNDHKMKAVRTNANNLRKLREITEQYAAKLDLVKNKFERAHKECLRLLKKVKK